jgi:hypothetical protein
MSINPSSGSCCVPLIDGTTFGDSGGGGSGTFLEILENLADVNNVLTSRTNLGLGESDIPTFANVETTEKSIQETLTRVVKVWPLVEIQGRRAKTQTVWQLEQMRGRQIKTKDLFVLVMIQL